MSAEPLAARRPQPRVNLQRLLSPRAIAVVGVSGTPSRIGGQALRLLTEFGYRGTIFPVNPKYREVAGRTCYPDLAALPAPCDVALIALAAERVPAAIEQCGKARIPFAVVLAGGFAETGPAGRRLQEELAAAVRAAGLRVLGPNCIGLLNLREGARIGFGGTMQLATLKPGPLAMVTQSGGFGFGVVAIACHYGLGFNYAVSTGNEVDLTALDWIEELIERPEVEIVTAFLEGVSEGRRLIAIGERALELGKPILVWKVGNTEAGRRAAVSHTARLSAPYELFRAAFRRGGLIEIRDVDDLVDLGKAFASGRLPAGRRLAVLTLSGGAGVLLADRALEHGLELPALGERTRAKLREILVSFAALDNPIDATAHGYQDNFAAYGRALRVVLADPDVDQVIARVPRGAGARPWAQALVETLHESTKPVILSWPTAPDDNGEVRAFLESQRIPCILAPGRAVRAAAALADFAERRRASAARGARPFERAVPPRALALPRGATVLAEHAARELLAAYGIPLLEAVLLAPEEIEALAAPPLPFPVAVKAISPELPHRTEAGAVRLGVADLAALKSAAREVVAAALRARPGARIEGVLVQEMGSGLELLAGAVDDPCFGPTVACGPGGVLAELLGGAAHGFAPFDAETAREMIAEMKGAALLRGYRGAAPRDVAALAEALARLSLLIADHAGRIAEIDINPLFVREVGRAVAAADALIILKSGEPQRARR